LYTEFVAAAAVVAKDTQHTTEKHYNHRTRVLVLERAKMRMSQFPVPVNEKQPNDTNTQQKRNEDCARGIPIVSFNDDDDPMFYHYQSLGFE
jgi:hypothetical protein